MHFFQVRKGYIGSVCKSSFIGYEDGWTLALVQIYVQKKCQIGNQSSITIHYFSKMTQYIWKFLFFIILYQYVKLEAQHRVAPGVVKKNRKRTDKRGANIHLYTYLHIYSNRLPRIHSRWICVERVDWVKEKKIIRSRYTYIEVKRMREEDIVRLDFIRIDIFPIPSSIKYKYL